MGRFPERNLNQTCLYWGAPIPDGYGGWSWDDPVELACRWVEGAEVVMDAHGNDVIGAVAVQVTIDVTLEGRMWLGTLDDLPSGGFNDPDSVGALPIVRFDKTPTVRGDKFYRLAFLGRVYRGVGL